MDQPDVTGYELSGNVREELVAAAKDAMAAAYCPYSNYAVGAAVLTANGSVFRGCNVENASYGLTICAERNAIGAAVTAGDIDFVAIAVFTSGQRLARPCGACRQVISEFSRIDRPILVISSASDAEVAVESINALLPERFSLF
jgi:cytidine deaminase